MNLQGLFVYFFLIGIMELYAIKVSKQSSSIVLPDGNTKPLPFLRWETLIPMLLFAVVFGMRWNVGFDHIPYLFAYIYDDTERFEWGYRTITKLFQKANIHYVFYFSLWAFVQIYFFFRGFKDEYYLFPFLTLFIFTQSEVSFWMNGIRQAIAMCIILYSVTFIDKREPIYYALFAVLAVLFHRSSIVFVIILYPILFRGKCFFKNVIVQYVLLALAFVGHFSFSSFFAYAEDWLAIFNSMISYAGASADYNLGSLEGFDSESRVGFVYIVRLIEVILIIWYSPKLQAFYNSRRFNILYNLFFAGVLLAYLAPGNIDNIDRLFRYLYIYRPIMLAYFAHYLFKQPNENSRFVYFGILFCDIVGWSVANLKNGWSFDFFFQHDIGDIVFYLK